MSNINNPAMASLARRLVIAELASRGAEDPETVEALVAPRLRLAESGDIVPVDHGGSVLPGKVLADVLDDVQRANPSLFKSAPASGKPHGKDHNNPFQSGPGHNITAQMILWRTDPERAEYLAAEAGLRLRRSS